MFRASPRRPWLVPVLAVAALLGSGVFVASKKRFWMDELFTRAVVTAPDAFACVGLVSEQLESNPPLYFLVAHAWTRAFGADEISLRVLAALLMSAGFVATWAMLRPFGARAAGLGAALAFGGTALIWEQNAEARPYGLFVCLAAATTAATVRLAARATAGRFLLAALLQAALVYTHVFGFAYGGALLLACLLADLGGGKRRLAPPLALLAGSTTFAAWVKPLLFDLEAGKPHSWIPIPTPAALLEMFTNSVPVGLGVALLVGAGALARTLDRDAAANDAASNDEPGRADRAATEAAEAEARRRLVLVAACFIVVVPATAFAWSRVGTSIFVDRYMTPCVVGWAVVLAAIARRALPEIPRAAGGKAAAICAGLLVAGFLVAPVVAAWREPPRLTTGDLPPAAAPYADLPVAFEVGDWFLPAWHYHPADRARLFYILDWEAALAPGNDLHPTVDYKLLSSLAAHVPDLHVVQSADFLAAHPRFLIIGFSVRRWSELRVEANPAYRVRQLAPGLALAEQIDASSRPSSR